MVIDNHLQKARRTTTTISYAVIAIVVAAIMLMAAAPMLLLQGAFAAPTLQGPITCSITGENQLRCVTNVSGLGGAKTATATLVATATVTTGCATPSGSNQPQGLQRTAITVTDAQTVNVDGGGRATFDLLTQPLNAAELRICPDGLTPTVVCVTFSNISIAVVPNSGPSRTFTTDQVVSNC
jgi:hypothetical protein